jgi:hypothetical protein
VPHETKAGYSKVSIVLVKVQSAFVTVSQIIYVTTASQLRPLTCDYLAGEHIGDVFVDLFDVGHCYWTISVDGAGAAFFLDRFCSKWRSSLFVSSATGDVTFDLDAGEKPNTIAMDRISR